VYQWDRSLYEDVKDMAKENANTGKAPGKGVKKAPAKVSPSKFFREMNSELKKVTWPSKKELTNYSIAVLILIVALAAIVGVIDLGLTQLMNLIIR